MFSLIPAALPVSTFVFCVAWGPQRKKHVIRKQRERTKRGWSWLNHCPIQLPAFWLTLKHTCCHKEIASFPFDTGKSVIIWGRLPWYRTWKYLNSKWPFPLDMCLFFPAPCQGGWLVWTTSVGFLTVLGGGQWGAPLGSVVPSLWGCIRLAVSVSQRLLLLAEWLSLHNTFW
jgi:hypothetical protein